jgi:serine/threonine-protein kinase
MVPSKVSDFIAALGESQLLSSAQLEELGRSAAAQGEDSRVLAKHLIQKYGLTNYQVNQLNQGRGKELAVGPYRVLDRLGEGGMGTVFKARHHTLGRLVAIKVVRKDKLARQAEKRFFREIQMAAQLVHPNIVVAYNAGEADGVLYFEMEYVDGTDLSKTVRKTGTLRVDQACEYIRQAALALQYAHERGVVHRDIKPANLLVARPQVPEGRPTVKILDMGLARLESDDAEQTNLTKIGTILGTPEYLAPEQALNSHTVDIRADLYSLGCPWPFVLAGRPPYTGEEIL